MTSRSRGIMLRRASIAVMLLRRTMVTAVEVTGLPFQGPHAKEPSLKAVNPLPALRHGSVITTIGSTPVIKLNKLAPEGVNVYVKAEVSQSYPYPTSTLPSDPHPNP